MAETNQKPMSADTPSAGSPEIEDECPLCHETNRCGHEWHTNQLAKDFAAPPVAEQQTPRIKQAVAALREMRAMEALETTITPYKANALQFAADRLEAGSRGARHPRPAAGGVYGWRAVGARLCKLQARV